MKALFAYLGGKSRLVKTLLPLIPVHACYAEVFAGAAWLLFAKEESASRVEVVNDINCDLITLYRVVRHHPDEFIKYFRFALVSRDEFERLRQENPQTLTDIQRAARFYYMLRSSFGGRGRHFGVSASKHPNLNLPGIEKELSAAHVRLSRVCIENLPYHEFVKRYDRPETFFYCDPPYWGSENDYGKGLFSREDFTRLSEVLSCIQGRFLLSINDVPEVRRIFRDFRIQEAHTKYSIFKGDSPLVRELLVMNYDPV